MSGEILTTIISVFALAFMISRSTNKLRDDMESRFTKLEAKFEKVQEEIKEFREEVHKEFKEFRGEAHEEFKKVRGEAHEEFKEVRGDIAGVNQRLSHTDGLVEGLTRALLNTNVA